MVNIKANVKKGDKYNSLTIIEESEGYKGNRRFLCKCDCGTIKVINLGNIRNGTTKGCGCLIGRGTHGLSITRIYQIWVALKSRCNDKKNKYYGGRGIKYCNKWKHVDGFMEDMLKSYLEHEKIYGTKDTTIDRINNDGNYSKENCRWATYKVQANNKSNNIIK